VNGIGFREKNCSFEHIKISSIGVPLALHPHGDDREFFIKLQTKLKRCHPSAKAGIYILKKAS
tara:strand:- start:3050 stop:3238 length:189 start_codon:yes stop_codon:yes gene_type:complete